MIVVENEIIKDIPVLHVVKQGKLESKTPLIIFFHGFTSAKEHNLHYAYLLAEKGFRVLLPDALLHGERSNKQREEELQYSFWQIVMQSIVELQTLVDEKESFIANGQIGVAGTSMGGCITLGALNKYFWIRTGVSLMGNPSFVTFAKAQIESISKSGHKIPLSDEEIENHLKELSKFDLSLTPSNLRERPLLFWHGKRDNTVPYDPAYRFYEKVRENLYNSREGLLQFITDEHAGHKVSRNGVLQTVKWFEKHLSTTV